MAVGGTAVGVSVGGMGVGDGALVEPAGRLVGMLVMEMGVPPEAQPAKIRIANVRDNDRCNFLIIDTSFLQHQVGQGRLVGLIIQERVGCLLSQNNRSTGRPVGTFKHRIHRVAAY